MSRITIGRALLDWTTGLTQNSVKMSFPAFFSVEEKLISYFFAEVAPLAC